MLNEHRRGASSIHNAPWRSNGAAKTAGRIFELHPALGVEGRAAILDLDLAILERLDKGDMRYRALRRFPTSAFDLSVLADLREPAGELERRLAAAAGDGLVEIEFVREYTGSAASR